AQSRLGARAHIVEKGRKVIQRLAGAVHVTYALAVHQKEMILPRPAGDIDIFPELDVALRAEDRKSAVAPGGQAIRREPIDAVIARGAVTAQKHLAKILEF